jgi:hypothetical protein
MPDESLPSPKEGFQWLSKNQAIGYFDKSAPTLDQSIKWWEAHPEDEDSFRVARLGRNVFVEVPKPKNPLDKKVEELVKQVEELTKEKHELAIERDNLNNQLSSQSTALTKRQEVEKRLAQLENSWFGGKVHRWFKKPDIPPS